MIYSTDIGLYLGKPSLHRAEAEKP